MIDLTKLTYLCHSSFKLASDDGAILYIDPFVEVGMEEHADLILVTHEHFDHNQTQLLHKNADCVEIHACHALLQGVFVPAEFHGYQVSAVPACNANHDPAECVGYMVEVDGKKLYFAGDTSTTECMGTDLAAMHLDYAFLPCDGVFNMDVEEASACARLIGAKHSVPIHTTPVSCAADCGFDRAKAEAFDCPGKLILEPGAEIEL